jgi:hypothetical protein
MKKTSKTTKKQTTPKKKSTPSPLKKGFEKVASCNFVDDRLKDTCLRIETKIALQKTELLRWSIGLSLVQVSSIALNIVLSFCL